MFDERLGQAIGLLSGSARMSLGALARRLEVDDAYVRDICAELCDAQQVARLEGNVIVWVGDDRMDSDGDRRPLTVMFVDLVGSTALSASMDPEELRRLMRAYQAASTRAVERFSGHVAQHLGDGLLVYFGFPVALEDAAARAVHAGLAILRDVEALGLGLDVRIGIHTGVVVIGDVGAGSRVERLALGQVPNVAARVQSEAEPGSVVISASTAELVEGRFALSDMGVRELKGVDAPMSLYAATADRTGGDSGERLASALTNRLVGREAESGELRHAWDALASDGGKLVLIGGEAGVGKTRLVQELVSVVGENRHQWLRCSAYESGNPLSPLASAIRSASGVDVRGATLEVRAAITEWAREANVADAAAPQVVANMLGLERAFGESKLVLGPQELAAKSQQVCREWLVTSRAEPFLVVLEDLHWSDATTLEWLGHLLAVLRSYPVLVVATHRPDFAPPWQGEFAALSLSGLPDAAVAELVRQASGGIPMPVEVVETIVERTDGVALFVEELTRAVLRSGALRRDEKGYQLSRPLDEKAIPASLHDLLAARLDQLGIGKEIAQVASVVGRQFDRDIVAEVSMLRDEAIHTGLDQLMQADLVRAEFGNEYSFRHALVQDAAYASTLLSRRGQFHLKVAEYVEERQAGGESAAVIAQHYDAADFPQRAAPNWHRAAEFAMGRSANVEAAAHLTRELRNIEALRESPARDSYELAAQSLLGYALMNARGYGDPEVESAYRRAAELAARVTDTEGLGPVLYGLFSFHASRAEYAPAAEMAERLALLAEARDDDNLRVIATNAAGLRAILIGELEEGQRQTNASAALADLSADREELMRYGGDFRGYPRTWLAIAHSLQGELDKAAEVERTALTLTEEHPYTNAFVLAFGVWPVLVGDYEQTLRQVSALQAICAEYGFGMLAGIAGVTHTWVVACRDQDATNIGAFDQLIPILKAVRLHSFLPLYLGMKAQAQQATGDDDGALATVDEALEFVRAAGGNFMLPALLRLRGCQLSARGDHAGALSHFEDALTACDASGAAWWRVGILTELAELDPSPERLATLSDSVRAIRASSALPTLARAESLLSTTVP